MRYRECFLVTHFRRNKLVTEKMYSPWTVLGLLRANNVVAVLRIREAY